MNIPPYIGLAGVAGAGKDTVFDRLHAMLPASFIRRSVADPLKESVAALFDCTLEELEVWKRSPNFAIALGEVDDYSDNHETVNPTVLFTIREFLQRYGTESHRGVFGDDFWLIQWENWIERHQLKAAVLRVGPYSYVNTSVRFENEAQRILDLGGEVWHIEGPQDDGAGTHESETRLPDHLISRVIDNTWREIGSVTFDKESNRVTGTEPDFTRLDSQIQEALR